MSAAWQNRVAAKQIALHPRAINCPGIRAREPANKRKCREHRSASLFQIRNLGVVTPVLVGGNGFPLDARAQPLENPFHDHVCRLSVAISIPALHALDGPVRAISPALGKYRRPLLMVLAVAACCSSFTLSSQSAPTFSAIPAATISVSEVSLATSASTTAPAANRTDYVAPAANLPRSYEFDCSAFRQRGLQDSRARDSHHGVARHHP